MGIQAPGSIVSVRGGLLPAAEDPRGHVNVEESVFDRRFDLVGVLPVVPARNENDVRRGLLGAEELPFIERAVLARVFQLVVS